MISKILCSPLKYSTLIVTLIMKDWENFIALKLIIIIKIRLGITINLTNFYEIIILLVCILLLTSRDRNSGKHINDSLHSKIIMFLMKIT